MIATLIPCAMLLRPAWLEMYVAPEEGAVDYGDGEWEGRGGVGGAGGGGCGGWFE